MTSLDELIQLLGAPGFGNSDPGAWTDLERYVGSELPADYKALLDAYGSGMIANTLIVTHPACETDAVAAQARFQEMFCLEYTEAVEVGMAAEEYPFPFHPTPGGLIYWGNGGGDDINHFFLPDLPNHAGWKIVSLQRKKPCAIHEGSFVDFVLDIVNRLCAPPSADEWAAMTPEHREWRLREAAQGGFTPTFTPFW